MTRARRHHNNDGRRQIQEGKTADQVDAMAKRLLRPSGESTTEVLLQTSLQVAVPLWIERVRQMTPDARIARGRECVDVIASAGDAILYRVPGKTAKNFNVLAEAISLLAFSPRGVTIFGQHWEATDE